MGKLEKILEDFVPTLQIKGLGYDPDNPLTPKEVMLEFVNDEPIHERVVQNNKKHLGTPIDANFAISQIINFNKIINLKIANESDSQNEKITQKENSNESNLKSTNKIKKIAQINYGITFHKDNILKALSQPGCHGLRFYLSAREIENDHDNSSTIHPSLVMVGIDNQHKDLNFDFKDSVVEKEGIFRNNKIVKNDSMIMDLTIPPQQPPPPPPPPHPPVHTNTVDNIDDKYVLLKIAKEFAKSI